MNDVEFLEAALANIQAGWCKGSLRHNNSYCALGACGVRSLSEEDVILVQGDWDTNKGVLDRAVRLLFPALPEDFTFRYSSKSESCTSALWEYNDDRNVSKEDVVDWFKNALELARGA